MTSVLFGFGLKFVFTNIKNWDEFLIIATLNGIFNIFINGSFQSHQYGKKIINRIKGLINNKCFCCCSKKIPITDFNDKNEVIKYNKNLAISLSINFIVSTSSSVIMITYFAMLMAVANAQIDLVVFQFMAASLGIECIVLFGQIMAFKKRDRKYFVYSVIQNCKSLCIAKTWCPIFALTDEYDWINILWFSLLLAWFWIGGLTGAPIDVSI